MDEHSLDGNAVASTLGAQDIRRPRRADLGLTWGRRGRDRPRESQDTQSMGLRSRARLNYQVDVELTMV